MLADLAFCRICNHDQNLTQHHIHPQQFKYFYPGGPDQIHESANLVLLCWGCHAAVHDNKPFSLLIKELNRKVELFHEDKRDKKGESLRQSLKDRQIQKLNWERLIQTLKDVEKRERIEAYRRIIKTLKQIHKIQAKLNKLEKERQ